MTFHIDNGKYVLEKCSGEPGLMPRQLNANSQLYSNQQTTVDILNQGLVTEFNMHVLFLYQHHIYLHKDITEEPAFRIIESHLTHLSHFNPSK